MKKNIFSEKNFSRGSCFYTELKNTLEFGKTNELQRLNLNNNVASCLYLVQTDEESQYKQEFVIFRGVKMLKIEKLFSKALTV